MTWLTRKDIGWTEIGEEFTRYIIFSCHYFSVFVHRIYAPNPHPSCHDHPWSFLAIPLWRGYDEYHDGHWTRRRMGIPLYRPAEFRHNVVTNGVAWSLVLTGPKRREWQQLSCE